MMRIIIFFITSSAILQRTFSQGSKNFCHVREASCVMESFGYEASCVLNALSTCENKPTLSIAESSLKEATKTISAYLETPKMRSTVNPRHCYDLKERNDVSGVRSIYPYPAQPLRAVKVFCDQGTDGGGWTVVQKRINLPIRENFRRSWTEYVIGFGNITGEFWLGLDNIHALTSYQLMELRVDLEDWDRETKFAKYSFFNIGDSSTNYILDLGGYSGTAGDGFESPYAQYNHKGMMFSTPDNDNDRNKQSCAAGARSAWWYNNCFISNLNGLPLIGSYSPSETDGGGISWHTFRGTFYSNKDVAMMIRPSFKS